MDREIAPGFGRLTTVLLGSWCLLAGACGEPARTVTEDAHAETPGLEYEPPAPGSYRLPAIQSATDGLVVDADGTRRRLFDYLGDKQVLLSFVYTTCTDAKGCPLATAVLHMIHRRLSTESLLEGNVRLVSLSFDPEHDTPEVMRRYVPGQGNYFDTAWEERPWVFLTTRGSSELEAILDGYGQYVVRERDESGRLTGRYTHVLKVFLIDRERQVRNIYSSSFLHPALAINDLKTLLIEEMDSG